ncbi:MAG: hypothetical protein ACI4QJ_03740, partial [Candidatus Spyradenecus sp.]
MKTIASRSFALPAITRALRWGGALLLAATCLAAPLRAQEVAEDPPAEVETALPTVTIPAEAADGSVVEIADGTYAPLNLLTETRTLTLRAATPGRVFIEGGNTERCATLPDNITLDGFVLQNGKARQGGGLRGGVFQNGTISNCSAVFGGGAYEAKVVNSEVIGCSAEFFGNALYGGSAFSCRIIGNHAADYGAGMAALFGTKAANCLLAENTTPCDTAGALASSVQNMLLYKNTVTKGTAMTAKAMAQDVCGNGVEEAKMFTTEEATLFNDDYTLNLEHAAINDSIKDKGDSALGGFYDLLWHATDLNGRPRILGTDIDIGPYEIADTVEVTCTVIGAGAVSFLPTTVQEGDTVTFTASKIENYERDFLGFYVNGELRTTEMTFSLAITKSDTIEARFKGLEATPENFTEQIEALYPSLREELLLADGTYTLDANTVPDNRQITFKGTTLGGSTLSVSGDLKGAILVNATVTCTAEVSNVTLHRCLVDGLTGTNNITVTSSILKAMPSSLIATMANVTVYGSDALPETIKATNCLVMDTNTSAENFDWVGQAILQKGSDSIDAGDAVSLTPYDNLDIAGRPRKMGSAIDLGAHECFYVAMSVTAEGEYTALTPAPGEHTLLAGDTLALAYTSSRAFLGWTLNGEDLGTEVTSLVIPEESTQALTASFQGFTLTSEADFPTEATAKDTITLGPGTYAWSDISTEAKIVGTGTQSKVTINGSVTGGRFEAVTLNATLTNATLNRCLVTGGTLTNCTVANSVIEAATLSGGTYVNNTVLSGIALPTGAVNTRTVSAVQENYTPAVTETTVVDSGSDLNDYQKTLVGDLDYYGNPRINNVRIDLGAAEYVWAPYTVTIAVVGHGLVEPRGTVEVVRGQSLTFTAKADPKHDRGTPVVTVGSETLSGSESHYTYTPTADNTIITVTFPGLTVGESETYTTLSEAIAEAQDGETITVQAGTYLERVDVKTKKLRIVAAEADATKTIIDANHEGRAVALNENSEIVGFTIINGAASEGAGVRGGTVRRCIIRDNTLTYNGFGGGIYGAFAESCLIYNNGSSTQRSSGGGASNSELLNCTVAANAAEKGGGLYDCTAKNCVIALNTDLSGITSDWAGDSIEPAPEDCCTPTSGGIIVEANKIFVRPETADFRLREGIACLNAAAADERLSALDVFGTQRPYGTGTDMGAIEWNAPDYVITLSFNSRSQATMVVNDSTARTYTCAWNGTQAERTFTVPRFKADGTTRTSIKLTWTKATDSGTDRTLSGILLDGGTLSNSSDAATGGFTWQVASENTVNVDLSFQAASLTVAPEGNLEQALADATPGETIKLQDGDYNLAVSVGAGVTLEGTGTSSLLQGATLADGAILKGVTVTGAPVVGPETGSATLLHSIVTGVTDEAGAVQQNVVVKSSLIHNNAAGLGANVTAYLSTVADTDGIALAATAKAYGCAIWRYSRLAETGAETEAEIVDCWAGIEPGFLAPAPEGEDYHLSAHSELIDAAGTAQWPGFTEADRALADLAGQPRNTLQGYDCGAYEYQGTATVTDWTWFGSSASMDGDLAGAGWRQMTLGSAHALPANVAAVWADRNGYPEAKVRADAPLTLSALTIKTVNTCFALLQGAEAGRVTVTGTLMKSAASSLVLAGPLTVQGSTTLSAGTVTVAEGADIKAANVTLNGSTTFRQTGGNFTFGNFFYARDTVTFSLEGGTFKGGELSVAKGSNQTALVFAGADVTLTRIETGDEAGARYGDIIQTGGTVTLTGSGSGKSAPLHISHWPGSSTYSLQGGTLYVPNGEVRLGQDGTGTLRLEGGVAKIRSIGRSKGSVVLAGGTFHALESQALNYVQYVSGTESRLEVAAGKKLTFYGTTDDSNTGGLTLGPGDFEAYNTITNRNLTLSADTRLTLSTADGEALEDRGALNLASPYTLTVPGVPDEEKVPVLTGTLLAAPLAVAKDLPLNTSTLVLKVKGTVSGLTSAYEKCYEITTQRETAEDNTEITNVFVTQRLNRPPASTIPVLTVDETTSWDTAAKWSTGSAPEATTPVIVRATETATLTMPTDGTLTLKQVTFDVAEGKTLTLANTSATITELRLVGAGTLDLGSGEPLSYANQTVFSGTMVVSNASQVLTADTLKNQHLRFAVNYTLESCAGFTLAGGIEVAAGKKLTCDSSLAGGEALVEAGATVVIGQGCTNRLNFTAADGQEEITLAAGTSGTNPAYLGGNVNAQNWKITADNENATKGLTLTGSVTLVTSPTSGTLAASALSSLTLEKGELTLSSAWAMPAGAIKAGAGCVTLPEDSSMAGSATFRGPVAFAEKKTFSVPGDLVFREGSVIYLPIGASFSATGSLVVEPGTRVVLTGTPTATTKVDLFKSTQAGGLSISTLTEVALALENPPADQVATLAPYLTAEGAYGYTLTLTTPNVWTGEGGDSNWSTAANWSNDTVPADGAAVSFPASDTKTAVTIDTAIAPSAIRVAGNYTFSGNGPITSKPAIAQSAGEVTWNLFPKAGSYEVATGATAVIAASGYYEGRFTGDGTVRVTGGTLELGASSIAFQGRFEVNQGQLALRLGAATASAGVNLVGGTLVTKVPATVSKLDLSGASSLVLPLSAPLTITDTFTASDTVSIAVDAIPEEEGTWLLMTLPEEAAETTFTLTTDSENATYRAGVVQRGREVFLAVYDSTQIAWADKTEESTDKWVINTSAIEATETAKKVVWFHDVDGVGKATVSLPVTPTSVMVTAQTTRFTLEGTFGAVPVTVQSGASVTLAATDMTPSTFVNDGTVTVTGTLDLTNTTFSGTGTFIAGTGGTIKVTAQQLAATTNLFKRGGGRLEVSGGNDAYTYPSGALSGGTVEGAGSGELVKTGTGTLYLQPTAFNESLTIQQGTVALTGTIALKARYFKFEVYERFNDTANAQNGWNWIAWYWVSSTWMGLSEVALTLSGERLAWPEGASIIYFDGGVLDSVLLGMGTDRISFCCDGQITNLLDGNTATQFRWLDNYQYASYGQGVNPRTYFVVDAGREVVFSGYDFATPTIPNQFFYKWNVSASNDLQAWHPSASDTGPTENESEIWQTIDERTLAASSSLLKANSWMTTRGYAFTNKGSGFWSSLTGPVTVASEAFFDLTSAVGNTHILEDSLTLTSVTGKGTLRVPTSLSLTLEKLDIDTLQLTGSTILTQPITATSATVTTLALDSEVAQAYITDGGLDFVLLTNYTADKAPELSWPDGVPQTTDDDGTWELVLKEDKTLHLRLSGTKREIWAKVSGTKAWDELQWTNPFGESVSLSSPTDAIVERVVLVPEGEGATLALPSLTLNLPNLDSLAIDFGETEGMSLTLNSSTSQTQTLPDLYVLGTNGGDVLCNDGRLTLSALSASAPYVGVTAEMLSGLTSGTNTYSFASDAVLGLHCSTDEAGSSIAGYLKAPQRGIAIRSGTLKASREDNFGNQNDNTKIRVDTGATLDAHGNPVSCVLTLNGGTLKNSTSGYNGTTKRQFYSISLTADSTVEATQSLHSIAHGYNEQVIALNGHTLTKTGAGEFSIASATLQGPGTIAVNAGTFALWNGTGKGSAVEGNVTISVAEGATLALRDTRTLKSGSCLTLSGNVEVAGTLTGDGAVTVAAGSVTLSEPATYMGLTTVQGGATLSAASLAGSLTCEARATLKPRAIDTPLSLGGTLEAINLAIDLSAFDAQPDTIPLITSPNALTTAMVATAGRYKPAVEQVDGTTWKLSYTYRFADTALTWAGGDTGDLADATWSAEDVSGLSLRASNGMIFPAGGTYTLTNNSLALAFPRGAVTIGANANVTLSSAVEQSGLCGDVTLENGATLKLVDSFAAYAGITGIGATLEMDVSMLAAPRGDLSVGTLKLTGSTLPTGTPRETFSCTTLVFSKELVAAIEAATTQKGTILTLASAYTDSELPTCTTLPAGYELQKTAEGALVVAFTAPVVTELHAQVPSNGNWTGLTWCSDAECTTKPTAIAWGAVTTVTLTNTAAAPVALTLPGNLTALTTMTIGSASEAITLSGATLPGLTTLTLNGPLTLDGAVISTIPTSLSGTGTLTFKNAAVSSTRGNSGSNFAYNDFTGRWVVERGATLTLAATATENQMGLLNWDSNVADSGQIEVRAGGTLAVNQKNAFGWNNVSAQKDHTVLVVNGGTVTIGTNEQHFRRKMEWHPGSVLDNQGTQFYLTRGVTMNVVAGESTEPVIFQGNAIELKGDTVCDGNANTAFVVAAGAVLQVDAAIVQDDPDDALALSGAGTVLFNGANTHTQATTVAAGTTIGGTGSVANSAVTFEEGSKLLAEGGSSVLTLNSATGKAQVVLSELVAESALPMAVLKTAETATVTLLPPADYRLSSTTADGVTTHTLDLIRYTALTATVDGKKAWDELPWQTPDGTPIASPRWAWVTALTFNVTADTSLTLPGNFSSLTALTVNGTGTLTLSGGALPALNTLSLSGNLTLDGAVISTIPASLSGSGTLTFKHVAVSSTRGNSGSNFAYNDFTGRWVVESGATLTLAATATENRKGLLNWDNTVADSGQIEVRAGGTLVVNQKNAFGWDNVSDQKDHTVLVVAGGMVTIGTEEQHFRRKMEWHPGSVLDN